MQRYKFNNNIFYKKIVFFFILYLSLILSFILSENSTGGAILDYYNQKNISKNFAYNFFDTLLNYDKFSSRHSPVLIILLSFLEKMSLSDILIRLIHLHLCLFLPFIFLKILKEKNEFKNFDITFIVLSALIFFSPTFRSLSIWPDSRLLGLTFFSTSILFYLKFENTKKYKYAILNVITCALSSYISPNFSIFSIYFLINFILFYGLKTKILIIIILNILFSIPAIYYIFILDINFINKSAVIGGLLDKNNIFFINIFNNILITFTLFFFYIAPFLLTKVVKSPDIIKIDNIIISFVLCSILAINFNYQYSFSGGGIFFKISYLIFKNNYLFYFISLISIMSILPLLKEDKFNILLFLLIIINNPQYTIYHKYFDPFLLIMFFSIFNFKFNIDKIKINKNILLIYFYFLSFLLISNLKFLWKI
jgi:hypothetical protein